MLQKIIYIIFLINTIISISDGIHQSVFNETNLLLSMSTQLSELRSHQEHQKQLIDGVIKTLEIQDHQEKLSSQLVRADIQILKADLKQQGKLFDSNEKSFESFVNKSDFSSLVEEFDRQKVDGIMKAMEIKSLKAELERLEKLIEEQGKLISGLVNKSDNQFFKEELDRQKADGVAKAKEIKSLKSEQERQKKAELGKEVIINSLKADLDRQGKLFNGLVNKSDIQFLKEDIERQKADRITKATEIKSELNRFEMIIDILEEKSISGCTEAQSSGIFNIRLFNFSFLPLKVFCYPETHNGGWTTILRRIDGSVDFYRNWTEYKNGFGNLSGEFFLGLDKIHAITSDRNQELLVILEDFEGDKRFETYDEFAIGDENQKYILHTLGKASGTANDSLSYHRGMKFSTFDNDNDIDKNGDNCAEYFKAAWWYNSCHNSNLMGRYKDNTYGMGVIWKDFRGFDYSLKKALMLIRPRK